MDVFSETDYKSAVRLRIRERNASGRSLTLKEIARKLPIQYTYLSRVLTASDKHLSEDHLFTMCNLLDFAPDEIEYLMCLRGEATTTNPSRRKFLLDRIAHLKESKKLSAKIRDFEGQSKEAEYLFEPFCVVIHVALGIAEYREAPHRLCPALGITRERLKEILRKLRDVGMISLGSDGSVTQVHRAHLHYSPQHPLMRAHQNFLRTSSLSHLARTDEEDRHSFMVTFSADPATFQLIKESFRDYIRGVEKKVVSAPGVHTYQIVFDAFKWL